MPTDQTQNVSLTAELNAFIRAQVASGQYQNTSDVVRAGPLLQQTGPGEPQTPRAAARGRHARQI